MTIIDQEQEQEKVVGTPITLVIAFDPHSGEWTSNTNAVNEAQLRVLADAALEVYQRYQVRIAQLVEDRVRAESNGQVNDG